MHIDRAPRRAAASRSGAPDGHARAGSSRSPGRGEAGGLAALAVLASLLSACAGVTSEIREENRDTSGEFDGLWEARLVEGRKSYNRFGNWTLKCDSWSERFLFDVSEGRVTFSNIGGQPSTFVDEGGRFRLEVPIEGREVSSRESGSVGRTARKLIFNGNLGRTEPRVLYTVGQAKYGWGGCNWPLDAERGGRTAG